MEGHAAGWPPAWSKASEGLAARRPWPPSWAPSKDQLDWTQKAVTALILVLALPWLLAMLMTNPAELFAGLGRHHVGAPA